MNRILKFIIIFAVVILLLILFFPYVKAEYLTAKHGIEFENEYKQIGWIDSLEYFRVIDYESERATVFYVEKNHNTGWRIDFVRIENSWIKDVADCVWSKSGSADNFCWPYYR